MKLPIDITISPKPRMHRSATTGLWITDDGEHGGLGHTAVGSWLAWLKLARPAAYSEIVAHTLANPRSPWAEFIPRPREILSEAESRAGTAYLYLPRRHLQLVSA